MVKFIPALTLAICLASVGGLRAQDMTKPIGRWERKVGKNHVALIVEDHRLHVSYSGENVVTLHADYATTRDGVIYGVVTSIEGDEDEEAEATKTLFDAPFSFRYRIDEGALIIHDAKSSDAVSKDDLWNGRFKAVRSALTHGAAASGSSYLNYFTPAAAPSTSPPPPTPIGSSYSTPTDAQSFNFWMGYIR
ncbi:MAG: hypothetical protein ACYC3I_20220 [Gemmataceae bacterium]